jgi:dihydroorotase
MFRLTLIRPDDWHLHLRDGAALASVVGYSARQFARAIVMPNLKPPVTTVESALAYRQRILQALPVGMAFEPLMTLYLTEATRLTEVEKVASNPNIQASKLYPAGATTDSDAGVGSLARVYPLLEAMEKFDVPLLVHGEVTDQAIDIFDREKAFIERELEPVIRRFPRLRIVLEHATTRDAVQFVREAGPLMAATLTAHHLLYNRNALLAGGIRPHYYCLPVLKREIHRHALVEAATSGEAQFFLGTDSAPHPTSLEESSCGVLFRISSLISGRTQLRGPLATMTARSERAYAGRPKTPGGAHPLRDLPQTSSHGRPTSPRPAEPRPEFTSVKRKRDLFPGLRPTSQRSV